MTDQAALPTDAYFADVLPWQRQAWAQLTQQFTEHHLPHGLLAAGQEGIGKHAFVWRLVAYILCQNRHEYGACGECDSCHWLRSGTHPDLMVLPVSSQLGAEGGDESIKIDDVRTLQEYSQTKGHGAKVIVLDHADTLTIGAANALLKTLEEPRDGVFLILLSHHPSRLLPTIKSRVQRLPLSQIDHACAVDFLGVYMDNDTAQMMLTICDGAPLQALTLRQSEWFGYRELWLKTMMALQSKSRSPIAASDYWQDKLDLQAFIRLSRLMLSELWRVLLGLPRLHQDIDTPSITAKMMLSQAYLEQFLTVLDDVQAGLKQNIQEKIAYDRLMVAMVG